MKTDTDLYRLRMIYREMVLSESPLMIDPFPDGYEPLAELRNNRLTAKRIIDSETVGGTIKFSSKLSFDAYCLGDEGTYFVEPKEPLIVAKFNGSPVAEMGYVFNYVWGGRITGAARFIVFEYFLKKYKFVQSDELHTPAGRNYWKRLLLEAISEKFRCVVHDSSTQEETILTALDVGDFYGDLESGKNVERGKFVFRIFRH